jgi:hypothetical protein
VLAEDYEQRATKAAHRRHAEGGDRDGAARPRLQYHARDEHRRYQTTSHGGPRLRSVYRCARRVTVQVVLRGAMLRPD